METRDLRAKYRAVDLWSLVAVGRLSVCAHATGGAILPHNGSGHFYSRGPDPDISSLAISPDPDFSYMVEFAARSKSRSGLFPLRDFLHPNTPRPPPRKKSESVELIVTTGSSIGRRCRWVSRARPGAQKTRGANPLLAWRREEEAGGGHSAKKPDIRVAAQSLHIVRVNANHGH